MADGKTLPSYIKFLFSAMSGYVPKALMFIFYVATDSLSLIFQINFLKQPFYSVGATMITYPLELLKTRMQVYGQGSKGTRITTFELAKQILQKEGVLGFYPGLSASCLRQATYTGVRMGAFQSLLDIFSENGKPPNLLVKCLCGCVSGAIGGVAGLPADVILTRMAADALAPPDKRRNYSGVFGALVRIPREEGLMVLFRGFSPTVIRAMIVNISQLVSYVQSKELLLTYGLMKDNTLCHVTCSIISALVATTCCLPPDIAKIRIQNMIIVDGKREYTGMFDVWKKVVKREGFFSLWKGFTPLFVRNGPQFVAVFVIYENLTRLYKLYLL